MVIIERERMGKEIGAMMKWQRMRKPRAALRRQRLGTEHRDQTHAAQANEQEKAIGGEGGADGQRREEHSAGEEAGGRVALEQRQGGPCQEGQRAHADEQGQRQ